MEYTLSELRTRLDDGSISVLDLAKEYLLQIEKINPQLNALSELNPEWMPIARKLDLELKLSGPRSPLHGIPIVIKDNINTGDKMRTTAGSMALQDLFAPRDAFLVKKLRDAGALILGKANLSEFAYFMSFDNMPSGYSSRKGQVKNPYGDLDPLGSSTGSAVMVSANMIPVSIGSETNGSLIAPATHTSICALKPTLGMISRSGMIPITSTQDTAGPMARSVRDLAIVLDQLWGRDLEDEATLANPYLDYKFLESCDRDISGLKLGILRFHGVEYSPLEEEILSKAKEVLTPFGVEVIVCSLEAKKMRNDITLIHEFKPEIEKYLASVSGHTAMKNLQDIMQFNRQDPKVRMKYGQSILEAAAKTSGTLTEPEYLHARLEIDQLADEINHLMNEEDIDVLLLPRRTSHAPVAGNPCLTIPAKSLIDLIPGNLVMIGRKWDEETLFAVGTKYEEATQFRVPPVL